MAPEADRAGRYRLLAGVLAVIYAALWSSLAVLFYRTFSLHVWDVGANYVLTNLSSPPGLGYGHLTSDPQNLIYVFFIPLVKVFPDPLTLVIAQNILMAIGGYVLFCVALELWKRPALAALVEALYLFNYAFFGAPYFPSHYEILFSVMFPIAFYFYLRERHVAAAVFLVLAAMCSSLGAVDSGLFVAIVYGPRLYRAATRGVAEAGQFVRTHLPYVVAFIATAAVFVYPFVTVGAATTLSYGHFAGGASPNLIAGILYNFPTKLVYFLLLLAPFVPAIARTRYGILAIPYLLLVLVSGTNNYDQFAYQYTYTVGAILFIAFLVALAPEIRPKPAVDPVPAPAPTRELSPRRLWRAARKHPELVQIVVIVAVAGVFILPYGPGNSVAGPYASLPFQDYHLSSLLDYTPYDAALWQMVDRIPANASVLLQENMPMLTTRPIWYEPGSYDGQPVDYALADPTTHWFVYTPSSFIGPHPTPMITWMNQLHVNESYGIVQEYHGAILLERGYTGSPVAFAPWTQAEAGAAFVADDSNRADYNGSRITVVSPNPSEFALRTDSELVLPPGTYALSFTFSTSQLTNGDRLDFGLWSGTKSPVPLATASATSANFTAPGTLSTVVMTFDLPGYVEGIHFAVYVVQWAGSLTLTSAELNQTSAN